MAFKDILRQLGFETYRDYLCSGLWGRIREKVLRLGNHQCKVCGCPAQCVHHKKYSLEVLQGEDLTQLVPLCNTCHESIEFDSNLKADLRMANKRLNRLLLGLTNEHAREMLPGDRVLYRGGQYTVRLATRKKALIAKSVDGVVIRVSRNKLTFAE